MSLNLMTRVMRNTLKTLTESNKFDRVLRQVNITSASNGRLIAEMPVTEECINWSDRLHGGMVATLVDQLSSLALATHIIKEEEIKSDSDFIKVKSVSIELSISYMNAIKMGETLVIEANTLKCGQNMAFLSVDLFNKQNNRLIATGKHTKYLLNK